MRPEDRSKRVLVGLGILGFLFVRLHRRVGGGASALKRNADVAQAQARRPAGVLHPTSERAVEERPLVAAAHLRAGDRPHTFSSQTSPSGYRCASRDASRMVML